MVKMEVPHAVVIVPLRLVKENRVENLTSPVSIKEIEFVMENLPIKRRK